MQKMNAELGIGKFTERHVEHYLQRFDTDQDKLLSQEEWPGCIWLHGGLRKGRLPPGLPRRPQRPAASAGSKSFIGSCSW